MSKRKRHPEGTDVTIPEALADEFEKFLKTVPSKLKNDAAPVLERWEEGSHPVEVRARTQKTDVC